MAKTNDITFAISHCTYLQFTCKDPPGNYRYLHLNVVLGICNSSPVWDTSHLIRRRMSTENLIFEKGHQYLLELGQIKDQQELWRVKIKLLISYWRHPYFTLWICATFILYTVYIWNNRILKTWIEEVTSFVRIEIETMLQISEMSAVDTQTVVMNIWNVLFFYLTKHWLKKAWKKAMRVRPT